MRALMMGMFQKKATTEAFFQKQTGTGLRVWTYHYQCQSGKSVYSEILFIPIMTKTSEKLYITYARNGTDMKVFFLLT